MRRLPTDALKIPSGFKSPQRGSYMTLTCETISGHGIPVMALPHARAVFLCWRQLLPETSVQGGWYHSNCSTHLALPHKPRHSYSALPGATTVYQSLAQGHSCLLSPKGGQHLIFIPTASSTRGPSFAHQAGGHNQHPVYPFAIHSQG